MSRRCESGFMLIEAIVAMVLISSVGLALFNWINTSLNSLYRVSEANVRAEASANVLEYMSAINPMLVPEGAANFGAYQIRWKSRLATEPRDGVNYPFGISLYRLALYDMDVVVERREHRWFDLSLRQVGYRKVRELRVPF